MMGRKIMNPLLQKQALDETFKMWNDPDYAIHQHHSDPNFTTQNGKDYAGRNTTENEEGALQDGIPANLLSVELGKTGSGDYQSTLNEALAALQTLAEIGPSEDIRGCAAMSAGDLRQFAEDEKAGKARRFSSDANNPNVTTMPSAPAPVNPDDATFFKESEPSSGFSPAEEKISDIVNPEGFHYGARVSDGSTLWFRGNQERIQFDPKSGNIRYSKSGKVLLECPVVELKKHVNQMLKSAAREFHETLKAMLGQTAAIRPSPHAVFEQKVDEATGKEPESPNQSAPVQQAEQTIENAEIGDQIGVAASKTASKWSDKIKKMEARKDPDQIEEFGTKMSGYAGGGPFSCMDCVHRTPHSKDANGEEVDSCKHPTVMADPELESRKLPDGKIRVDNDDCCRFVRPTGGDLPEGWHVYDTEGKEITAAFKPKLVKIASDDHAHRVECKKCGNVQNCRCPSWVKRVTSFVNSCSNCDGTFDKDGAVTKSYGTGTPFGGTPNDPSEDVEDDEDEKVAGKTAEVDIHETPKFLPPRDDIRRHIDPAVKDEVMMGVDSPTPAKPNQIDPRNNPDGIVASAEDDLQYELDREDANEEYLDTVRDMKNEAKAAFLEDSFMLQDAVDADLTMDQLWAEVGESFTQNYWESTYSKQGSIEVFEGLKCPNCKSTKGKPVEDGETNGQSLRECLTCGSFF